MSLKGQIRPIKFSPLLTNEEVLAEMGRRLAAARIRLRLTQAELAAKAGISVRTYRRLEKGAGLGSLEAFVSVLRAFRFLDRLEVLLPPDRPSPSEIFERESRRKPLPTRVRKSPKGAPGGLP